MKNIMPPVIPNAVRDLTNSRSHAARKNRSSKRILVFFALGLISCALCVQQAQAVTMQGAITFAGGATLGDINGFAVDSVNDATQVLNWLDQDGNLPTVQSSSGSFAGLNTQSVTFAFPWSFNSGPIALFWQVGGFTFNLIASSVVFQGGGLLYVTGTGIITGNGYDPTPGDWSFSTQDDPADGVFTWSGGSAVPDGGPTVALLGVALAGIEGIRRKLKRAKS